MSDLRKRVRGTDDPINPEFPEGRWQDALRRMQRRIAAGLPLRLEDSDAIGDKRTCASWGMCSGDREQWPEADDHVFPNAFVRDGRVTPRDPPRGARCPLDLADPGDLSSAVLGHYGCFYRCLLFQAPEPMRRDPERLRLRVLQRFEESLAEREAANGARSTELEPWSEVAGAAE